MLNCISARFGKDMLLTFCSFKVIMFECTAVIINLFPAKGRPLHSHLVLLHTWLKRFFHCLAFPSLRVTGWGCFATIFNMGVFSCLLPVVNVWFSPGGILHFDRVKFVPLVRAVSFSLPGVKMSSVNWITELICQTLTQVWVQSLRPPSCRKLVTVMKSVLIEWKVYLIWYWFAETRFFPLLYFSFLSHLVHLTLISFFMHQFFFSPSCLIMCLFSFYL